MTKQRTANHLDDVFRGLIELTDRDLDQVAGGGTSKPTTGTSQPYVKVQLTEVLISSYSGG